MVIIAGHRGWSTRYPDNTLAGIEAAAAVADMVELDVRSTRDGYLVLSHDPVLGGKVLIEHSWDELRSLDLGDGCPPALFDEILARLPHFPLDIEIKNNPAEPDYDPTFAKPLKIARLARDIDIVTSFHWPTMGVLREELPARTGIALSEGGSLPDAVDEAVRRGHGVVAPHWSLVSELGVSLARDSQIELATWTVNDDDQARRMADMGVEIIITDDPPRIRAALEA